MAGRIEELTKDEKDRIERIPNGIEYELKKFFYEIANAYHPPTFAALRALAPESHILFGTDYPYVSIAAHVDGLASVVSSSATLRAIERDNALALFPRFSR